MVKLIFLSGSIRKGSFNVKLARQASEIAGSISGVDASYVDLADYDMPIYNGDLEEKSGIPDNAKRLKQVFKDSDGFFIASPEYNSSFSPLLKNSLDWISRPHQEGEGSLVAFAGKVSLISAASPGGFGGLRGLVMLRMMLENISVMVLPKQLAIPFANNAFSEDGKLLDKKYFSLLEDMVKNFADVANRMKK
jgi:NAD(P)H-dependent FMN reductase